MSNDLVGRMVSFIILLFLAGTKSKDMDIDTPVYHQRSPCLRVVADTVLCNKAVDQ